MRRFVTLLVLLLVSVPFGISISGCGKKDPVVFCNASSGDAGVVVGQLNNILLQPVVYGISLNYGQIGQISSPAGTDCKGTAVTPKAYTYGSRDVSIVDVNPATGALCAGTWNRNLNVIPDFTVCTPPTNPNPNNSVSYITAEADGVTSNPIPVYTHPTVTSVVLGTSTTNCSTDPTTNCCPLAANNTIQAPPYTGNSCLSQGTTGQLVARVFSGTGTYNQTTGTTTGSLQNISCQAGHLAFSAQTGSIVTIDENGVATAQQPGSTIITASVANAGSSAGFFSTCPPTSINLSSQNTVVTQNFNQPVIATVLDQNSTVLAGLALEYVSTTPTTISVSSSGVVTPPFPGAASITAICQPPSCNPAPFNQIGLLGNGKPVISNPISITTPGSNSTQLYLASMATPDIPATSTTPEIPATPGSRYLVPIDFTTSTLGNPVQLPYVPNSMVISQDGTSIYMGSSTELMVVNAATNGLMREDKTIPGTVLAVSPDNSVVVIADQARKLVYLEFTNITTSVASTGTTGTTGTTTPSGIGILSQYGAVGTHAQWSPDSQTVYITAADPISGGTQLLVYSTFTGWNNITPPVTPLDVAVTVPSVGAYFAGASETDAVGYCPSSTINTVNGQTTTTNVFNPQADTVAVATDRIAATNDGKHIIGAAVSNMSLSDIHTTLPSGSCPSSGGGLQFASTLTSAALSSISPAAITGIFPTSDSGVAMVTYAGTGSKLPSYAPTTGVLTNIPLSGGATAPVAGVWSTDNLTFFTGTSGDNLVHLITRGTLTSPLTDSKSIAPNLPGVNGGIATPNLLVEKPRKVS